MTRPIQSTALASLLVAAATVCGPAVGQSPTSGSAAGEPDNSLQEITITATRQSEKLSHVPISVAAITQEQMDSEGVKNIDDVIRLTTGIQINRTGNNQNNIAIRGI